MLRPSLIIASLMIATPIFAETAPKKPAEPDRMRFVDRNAAQRVVADLDADASVRALFALCPADAYARRSDMTDAENVADETCRKNPRACFDACRNYASGRNCFHLAFAFQNDRSFAPLVAEKLFSLACASAYPAGCTNRAAGIRNVDIADDPFAGAAVAAKQSCEFRSFTLACGRDDSWGCAMLGQSYGNGEGVAADAAKARSFYEKSCRRDPKFAACNFARRGLSALDRDKKQP